MVFSIDHDIWMKLAARNYNAYFVNEPLVTTYETKQRKSMVNDTAPRIYGVEQYLQKWSPTFREWFGDRGGEKYIKHYRTRVLGGLVSKKFCEGNLSEALSLFRHVIVKNGFSVTELAYQLWLVFRDLIRQFVPYHLIDFIKKNMRLIL